MGLSKELKIGVIIVAALAALILGAQYLKGNNLFNRSKTFYGIYDQVGGLAKGSPVTLNGFQIGQVADISLYKKVQGKMLVTFMVTNHELEFSRDSEARVESLDIMGSKTVAIKFGVSTAMAQDGDTLTTAMETGLMDEVNAQIAPLRMKTESMVASIDSVMTVMESLLKNSAEPNLEQSFVSLRKTLASLEHTSQSLDGLITSEKGRLSAIFKNVETITQNLADNGDDLSNMIQNLNSISDSLVKADITAVVRKATEAVDATSAIMTKINVGEGTLGMLINNDSLYTNLESASKNLDELLEDIRVNPKRYVSFSIIERREKDLKLSKKELEQLRDLLKEE